MKSFVTNLINQKNNKSVVNLSFKWNLLDFLYLIPQLLKKSRGCAICTPSAFWSGVWIILLDRMQGFLLGKGEHPQEHLLFLLLQKQECLLTFLRCKHLHCAR